MRLAQLVMTCECFSLFSEWNISSLIRDAQGKIERSNCLLEYRFSFSIEFFILLPAPRAVWRPELRTAQSGARWCLFTSAIAVIITTGTVAGKRHNWPRYVPLHSNISKQYAVGSSTVCGVRTSSVSGSTDTRGISPSFSLNRPPCTQHKSFGCTCTADMRQSPLPENAAI